MPPDGPAMRGGCVTRRSIRQQSWYPVSAGPRNCPGARRVWRGFWHPGTNFIEHYACRGTSLIGAGKLSPVTKLDAGTGAVSWYKLSRRQELVTVQDFNCGQMRALPTVEEQRWVSGCNNHYKFVLGEVARDEELCDETPHRRVQKP